MNRLLIVSALLLSALSSRGAVHTKLGASDNKTPVVTGDRQAALFSTLTNNSSITIACWVKYDWTDAGVDSQLGGGPKQALVSKGRYEQSGADGNIQFGLSSVSEKIGFSFSNPNGTYQIWRTTANSVQTNTWMHLACSFTYSNAASMQFYINGSSTSGSWGTGTGNANALTNATTFHTFLYAQNGGSSFFGGAMSDLAIWTNALSTGEIRKLAFSKVKYMALQVQPASLLSYWPMDCGATLPIVSGFISDRDRTYTHFDLDAGGLFQGERVLSYQPNE